jgi:hypothetical protein
LTMLVAEAQRIWRAIPFEIKELPVVAAME